MLTLINVLWFSLADADGCLLWELYVSFNLLLYGQDISPYIDQCLQVWICFWYICHTIRVIKKGTINEQTPHLILQKKNVCYFSILKKYWVAKLSNRKLMNPSKLNWWRTLFFVLILLNFRTRYNVENDFLILKFCIVQVHELWKPSILCSLRTE
jgi:hypothetical protein